MVIWVTLGSPQGAALCSPSGHAPLEFVLRSLFLQDLDLPWTTATHDTPPVARGTQLPAALLLSQDTAVCCVRHPGPQEGDHP